MIISVFALDHNACSCLFRPHITGITLVIHLSARANAPLDFFLNLFSIEALNFPLAPHVGRLGAHETFVSTMTAIKG